MWSNPVRSLWAPALPFPYSFGPQALSRGPDALLEAGCRRKGQIPAFRQHELRTTVKASRGAGKGWHQSGWWADEDPNPCSGLNGWSHECYVAKGTADGSCLRTLRWGDHVGEL